MKNQKEVQWLLKDKYNNKLPVNRQDKNQFKKDIKRMEKGEPVDYIIGFTEFLGCKIDLSKKPLIPRKETEYWTAIALNQIKDRIFASKLKTWQPGLPAEKFTNIKCLDIFAGSGCIGVAILANTDGVLCDFSDKEKKFLEQVKINLKKNFINEKKYKVINSNIFSKIKEKYDFIFANPPYIPIVKKNKIQKSVLKYEPKQALFGGKEGMNLINKFLKNARNYLLPNGKIYMEFDSPQKNQIENLLKKLKYKKWQFFNDQYKKARWVEIEL